MYYFSPGFRFITNQRITIIWNTNAIKYARYERCSGYANVRDKWNERAMLQQRVDTDAKVNLFHHILENTIATIAAAGIAQINTSHGTTKSILMYDFKIVSPANIIDATKNTRSIERIGTIFLTLILCGE